MNERQLAIIILGVLGLASVVAAAIATADGALTAFVGLAGVAFGGIAGVVSGKAIDGRGD